MQVGVTQHSLDVKYLYDNQVKLVHLCKRGLDRYNIRDVKFLIQSMGIDFILHGPSSLDCGFDTYLISDNERLRNAALEILEGDLKICRYLGAKALVVHLTSYNKYASRERAEVIKTVNNTLDTIEEIAYIYNTPVYIEYTGHDCNFSNPKEFADVLTGRNNVGLALDTGNLYLSCLARGYDFEESFDMLSYHAKTLNLWNTKGEESFKEFGYIPPHWEQHKENGWIDIKSVIENMLRVNCDCPITLDINPNYKGPDYSFEGINWVKEIVYNVPKKIRAHA